MVTLELLNVFRFEKLSGVDTSVLPFLNTKFDPSINRSYPPRIGISKIFEEFLKYSKLELISLVYMGSLFEILDDSGLYIIPSVAVDKFEIGMETEL